MTITQPDLFSFDPATEDGIRRAEDHADAAWKHAAEVSVRWCAHMHVDFTTDQVWRRLAEHYFLTTHQPSAMGAVIRSASRAGTIRKTGQYRASERTECHRDNLTVWTKA